MLELLHLTTTLSALGAGGAAAEVATLASAGRPGLELQIPAPVGRQQRRHVQHTGVHADPCQPQRAPLLQLPSRGLPSLTARGRQAPLHPPLAGPWRGLQRAPLAPTLGLEVFLCCNGGPSPFKLEIKEVPGGSGEGPALDSASKGPFANHADKNLHMPPGRQPPVLKASGLLRAKTFCPVRA